MVFKKEIDLQKNKSENYQNKIFMDAPVGILTVNADLVINFANETLLQFELTKTNAINDLMDLSIYSLNCFQDDNSQQVRYSFLIKILWDSFRCLSLS